MAVYRVNKNRGYRLRMRQSILPKIAGTKRR